MSRSPRPYKAEYRHPLTGKKVRVSAPTQRQLAASVAYVDRLREDLQQRGTSPEEVDRKLRRHRFGVVTVERAARSYMERPDIADNTRRRVASFLRAVGRSLAALELDALDGPTCDRWIGSLRRTTEPASLRTHWRTLRMIVRHAAARGWTARVPWGSWRPVIRGGRQSIREAARTASELLHLLTVAARVDLTRLDVGQLGDLEAKIAAAALVGLRQGELAALRWDDCTDPHVLVREPKTGARRIVSAPELFPILSLHRRRLEACALYAPRGPVFPCLATSITGRPRAFAPRTECLPRVALRDVVRRAGLPNPARWTTHSLRDSFATLEAIGHGGDLASVQERTGHKSRASLARYLHSRGREPAAPGFTLGPRVEPPAQLGR